MIRPWLLLPSRIAHDLSPYFLKIYSLISPVKTYRWKSFSWKNLKFENPLGIAGGVDKNADSVNGWWSFGAGFIEIGTITPEAQKPNPGTIMLRDIKGESLWNKMGFPNKGMNHCLDNLKKIKKRNTPIFANIGKNRSTPNDEAHKDYIKVMDKLASHVDAFVLNISSPNTKGLRDLFNEKNFSEFLNPIINHNQKMNPPKPLLLKLSPDITQDEMSSILDTSSQLGIDGWILSNTTTHREGADWAPVEGGVSGRHLASISRNLLQDCLKHLGDKKKGRLVISCGGVLTPEDVYDRLKLGADLVQVYSALIFTGPHFFKLAAKGEISQ